MKKRLEVKRGEKMKKLIWLCFLGLSLIGLQTHTMAKEVKTEKSMEWETSDLSHRVIIERKQNALGSYDLVIREKKAGALQKGERLYFEPEQKDKIHISCYYTSVKDGDIEIEHRNMYIGNITIEKASTKPSTICLSYEVGSNDQIPYKDYNMKVKDQVLNDGMIYKNECSVIKSCISVIPYKPIYTPSLYQAFYFREDSYWYMQSEQSQKDQWPKFKRKRMTCKVFQSQGKLMIPLKYILSGLEEGKIEKENEKIKVSFVKDNKEQVIYFEIGKKEFEVNGKKVSMGLAPELKEGITFVPIEEVAKAIGAKVTNEPDTHSSIIEILGSRTNQELLFIGQPILMRGALDIYLEGKIVLVESEEERLHKGEIILKLDEEVVQKGIKLVDLPIVNVKEGDIQLGEPVLDNEEINCIRIPVTRVSSQPSYIEIEGFNFQIDRTVPGASYWIGVGGDAIGKAVPIKIIDMDYLFC